MRSSLNFEVLKEPRGFIKCLEIFLAIFAFSCATGYRGTFKIEQRRQGESHVVVGDFKYPFGSGVPVVVMKVNGNGTKTFPDIKYEIELNKRHSAEFFVVIGVFCFLYSLGVLIYYIAFEEDAQVQAAPTGGYLKPPVIDFVAGLFWAFFWFVSSCAQAAALTGIKDATNAEELAAGSLPSCGKNTGITCEVLKKAKYATLTVSVLLGFLNTFVWAGNMWFLWKETPWHNARNKQPASTISQQNPPPTQQVPSSI